jgi:endothelin-converting enzyme
MVRDLEYYTKLSSIIKSTSRETMHNYFEWRLISRFSSSLHQNYTSSLRAFNNARSGRDGSSIPSRWRICIEEVDDNLGYLLGAAFIKRFFPKENKDFGDRIISEVKDVFKDRFDSFEWMSKEVKVAAAKKGKDLELRKLQSGSDSASCQRSAACRLPNC